MYLMIWRVGCTRPSIKLLTFCDATCTICNMYIVVPQRKGGICFWNAFNRIRRIQAFIVRCSVWRSSIHQPFVYMIQEHGSQHHCLSAIQHQAATSCGFCTTQ